MSKKENTIYCNCCGRKICKEGQQERVDFLTIEKEWGYFSDRKDGQIHRMNICETCYDTFVRDLAIAPETRQATELV